MPKLLLPASTFPFELIQIAGSVAVSPPLPSWPPLVEPPLSPVGEPPPPVVAPVPDDAPPDAAPPSPTAGEQPRARSTKRTAADPLRLGKAAIVRIMSNRLNAFQAGSK